MNNFIKLFKAIDGDTSTNAKISALVNFFQVSTDQDKIWAIALFSHRRPKRTITTRLLRTWAAEIAHLPDWLFEESYHIVGDLAETISLLLPQSEQADEIPLHQWIADIIDQKNMTDEEKKVFVLSAWSTLTREGSFLFNKIITGGFRVGVSQKLMTKALSKYLDEEETKVAHKLMGDWTPENATFQSLLLNTDWKDDSSKPFPFYLAYALETAPHDLGDINDWQAEWKWDGIRAQIIKRKDQLFIWSRGEELVTDMYPEFNVLLQEPNDFVLDGELIVRQDEVVMPFQLLQKRIGLKKVSAKKLKDYPVSVIAYDLLEINAEDIRDLDMYERRKRLEKVIEKLLPATKKVIQVSDIITAKSWDDLITVRTRSREMNAEGLMLKLKAGQYRDGRRRGEWWKWKVDPFTIDAVMLYAQRGHGRRSNLFTDFTFAVWDGDRLVPFTKAYSGLTDVEFAEITSWVNKNTIDKFGPVRSVTAELVFEIAFEGIQVSSRHKCGIALRFPRIKRWRRDKPAAEANELKDLKALL